MAELSLTNASRVEKILQQNHSEKLIISGVEEMLHFK
jgi:hypothetical protein